jgi:hypothetical protein
MKNQLILRSCALLFLVSALAVQAEEKKDVLIKRPGKHPPMMMATDREDGPMEKEKVTFLGVETAPVGRTLAAQLGLPVDMGLVVARVSEGSPAASQLKEHDMLMKFDDQLLVDTRQLSVLVRARQEGEEVPLTLYRGGKAITLKVKLGQREMPKHPQPDGFPPGGEHEMGFFHEEFPGPGEMRMRQFPGMEPDDAHNVMRMIGRERHNWFGAPPVHFFGRKDRKGSTMLNLAEGNFVFSDDAGSVEVQANEGKRELTVKNPKGEVIFHGPINNADDREKLPPEVMARLHQIEKSELNDEPGEDFERQMAVEPPNKIKISERREMPRERGRASVSPSY